MQIVTDRGCDVSPSQLAGLDIHFAPMRLIGLLTKNENCVKLRT